MHQPCEDFHTYISRTLGTTKPAKKWFIIMDVGSDTYYLKSSVVKTKTAHWTKDYRKAQQFDSEHQAKAFVHNCLGKRQVLVIEHEVKK